MKERKNKRKKERIKERKQERMIERNTDTANTECEGTLQSDTDRISIHRARQTKQKERKNDGKKNRYSEHRV